MSRRLERMPGLSQATRKSFRDANLTTPVHVLTKNIFELLKILECSHASVQSTVRTICCSASPSPKTAYTMLYGFQSSPVQLARFSPTALSRLDATLAGGLPFGCITEIAGPPGAGKTQFCLTLSAAAACISSYNVVYIDTEGAFSAERFLEIVSRKFPASEREEEAQEIAARISVLSASNFNELLAMLQGLSDYIITKDIKLVIVDSVASLLRKEYGTGRTSELRNVALCQQTAILKKIAESVNIPVLVTNQVAYAAQARLTDASRIGDDDGSAMAMTAALGNTWSHDVNTRLIIQASGDGNSERKITVVKSPLSPIVSIACVIEDSGISEL